MDMPDQRVDAPTADRCGCDTKVMPTELPAWALEMAWVSDDDQHLPSALDGVNLVLNRMRLAAFLAGFAEDRNVRDLLALDVLGTAADLPLSSTGLPETLPSLAMRPFRIWEYVWLYKVLALGAGGLQVLDLGGPASHLSVLAALAGCHVTSLDINPNFVRAAQQCARALNLAALDARVGDMRNLSPFSGETFDAVICCSVLEHLTARDQETALREAARVLKPGGLIGLTFDLGLGAPGVNEHLPPPHDPPPSSAEAMRRFLQGGLVIAGNPFLEDPIPGSLFRHESIHYTVASLFLAKPPAPDIRTPQCDLGGSRLDGLGIRELPYKLHRHMISETALLNNIQIEPEELQHASAGQRMAALREKERAIVQLRAEIDTRENALNDMRSQLERAVATVNEQHQRAALLERAAAERLAALQQEDQAITQLRVELATRDDALSDARGQLEHAVATVNEQHRRAGVLEEAAALGLHQVFRHYRVGIHREVGKQRRMRLRQRDHDGVLIGCGDRLDGGQQEAPAALESARPLNRVHDVVRGYRLAVAELRVAQVERIDQAVRRDVPGRGKVG